MPIRPDTWRQWRPVVPTLGWITGMPVNATVLATDGNLGIFKSETELGHNLGIYFIGHVGHFLWANGEGKGSPGPLFSTSKEKSEQGPKVRKQSKQSKILAFLNSLDENEGESQLGGKEEAL